MDLIFYTSLLEEVKARIRQAQTKATLAANTQMIMLYYDIGKMIHERQQQQGWSSAVIPRLSKDLKNELPEVKGFSERNLSRMLTFFREYTQASDSTILPQPVAKLEGQSIELNIALQLPWGHNLVLIEKIKDLTVRLWYAQKTIQHGWSRDVLSLMIESKLHLRQGSKMNNFVEQLPDPQSDLARQSLKDPYIFDFLTLTQPFTERELETELIRHIEKFLLELGKGFAFVGRQYQIEVGDQDYYLDLLFYHLQMRCFVVIDLKKGEFKPEYAGKMNFYCAVVDDLLRHPTDGRTIGLILCQTKNKVMAEYALRGVQTPIGVSEFELTRALPENYKSSLPTIEDIENELTNQK
ncbi:DUF1016 domain-containing protein [Rhodocytophaga rosea]|uniref:DUF1016 domain-containing protein n=1 Tax=Rhodocytophaga rosea TaxID=2704465 RepID=A0A6C0GBG4_9BACT|nr:PDDEXK nuclease domain-containing protein [Rhodocytophaga rosea]QHT65237.1 DUF1016 domain-containing protein [Rhodocytophaga rosea]